MIGVINAMLHGTATILMLALIWEVYRNSNARYTILRNRIEWLERRMDRKESNGDA